MLDPFNPFAAPAFGAPAFGAPAFGAPAFGAPPVRPASPFALAPTPTGPPVSPQPPLLNPADEQSLLDRLGSGAVGGLGFVGGTLDKLFGGRAVRTALGLLTGNEKAHARDLLSILPGSDLAGLTDPGDAVSGTDLVMGGTHPDDLTWGDHALGFATEALLDPATYLSLGAHATTKLGDQAAKLGIKPPTAAARIAGLGAHTDEAARLAAATGQTVADVANQPLGGLAKLSIPFTDAGVTLGTGPTGQALASAAGKVGDKLLYSRPGRALSQLFDGSISFGGFTPESEAVQRSTRNVAQQLPGAEAKVRGQFLEEGNALEAAGGLNRQAGVDLRAAAENPGSRQLAPELDQVVGGWKTDLDRMLQEGQDLGRPLGQLQDQASAYFPRQRTALESDTKFGRSSKGLDPSTPNQIRRVDEFRDIPGGTETVNNILKDPLAKPPAGAGNVEAQAQYILEKHLGVDPLQQQRLEAYRQAPPAPEIPGPGGRNMANPAYQDWQRLENLSDKSSQLARTSQGYSSLYTEGAGKDFFGNHPLADITSYRLGHEKAQLATRGIYDALADVADVSHATQPGAMALGDVLKRAGLSSDLSLTGGTKQLLDRLQAAGKLPAGAGPQALANLHVPADVARDVLRYGQAVTTPGGVQPFLEAFDSITNLTKAWQTAWAPAFHTRNGLTGAFMNWVTGAKDARLSGPAAYAKPYQDYLALRAGGEIKGAAELPVFKGAALTDAQASRKLSELMYQHDVLPALGRGAATEAVGQAPTQASARVGEVLLPGREPAKPFKQILKDTVDFSQPGSRNPLAVAGVSVPERAPGFLKPAGGGTTFNTDQFALIKGGRELGHAVDEANRGSAFLAYLSQGIEPAEAAAKAKAAHYDYGKLSPFERQVMRRAIPFYGWMRNNVPFMLGQLASEPGGKVAQSIRATNDVRQTGGFLPDQLAEGLGIPLGDKDEQGNRRYLTNLGLPFEDAFPIAGGPHGLQRTGEKALGQLNPIIKAPLEYATGRQFFSGRELQDLYSRTGTGSPLVDQLLMNSPLGRPIHTVSTLADFARKGLSGEAANLLGPGRVTDVNIPKAQRAAARNYLEDTLRQNPAVRSFTDVYVPNADLGQLSPQELQLLSLYRTMANDARQQAASRRPPAAAAGAAGGGLNFPVGR